MKLKIKLNPSLRTAIIMGAIAFGAWNIFGLGGGYPTDQPANQPSWPSGMYHLVNTSNRIGGLWVNAEDMFFFSGTASNFSTFLDDYSKIQAIEKHQLFLHAGFGEAFTLGGGNKRPCDWKLYGCPKGWRNLATLSRQGTNSTEVLQQAGKDTNYVLEVHFWTGGRIALDQIKIPPSVEVKKEK